MFKGENKLQKVYNELDQIQSRINTLGKLIDDSFDDLEEKYRQEGSYDDSFWVAAEKHTNLLQEFVDLMEQVSKVKHNFREESLIIEDNNDNIKTETLGERIERKGILKGR